MTPSDDEIHKLGGLKKDEIERPLERLDMRTTALEKCVMPNGRPGLEDRLKEYCQFQFDKLKVYVDERDTHKQANAMQAITQVNTVVDLRINTLERRSEERHKENTERLDRNDKSINAINVKLGIAIGVAAVAQIVVQHVWH